MVLLLLLLLLPRHLPRHHLCPHLHLHLHLHPHPHPRRLRLRLALLPIMALLALLALPVLQVMMGGWVHLVHLVLLLQSIPILIQVPMNQSFLAASIDIPTMGTSIPLTKKSPSAFTLSRIIAHIAPCTSTISTLTTSFVNTTSLIAFLIRSIPALLTNTHLIMSIVLPMRIIAANLTTPILVLMITLLPVMSTLAQPTVMSSIGIATRRHTPTIVLTMRTLGLRTMELLANRATSSNFRIQNRLTSLVCSSLIGVRSLACLMGQRSTPYM
jgi:hypothetical protein